MGLRRRHGEQQPGGCAERRRRDGEQREELLGNVDLTIGKVTKQECEDQSKGKICSQTPGSKTKVDKNTTVDIVVSTGAPKVTVPDMEGLPYEKAKSDLEDKGFDVQQKTEESDRNPGVVISQDPEAGTEQEKGSTITLTVAKEKEQSTVPDVLGKTCDEAKAQMEANDLSGNCQEVDTQDPNQVGKVISTSPTAGSAVDKDSTVTIQIGKQAKQKTPVPSVVGQTVGQAKQTLAAAGFTNIQFANGSDQNDTAFVTDQDPKGNQQVDDPANTQITLTTVGFGNGGNNNGGGDNGGIFG